MKEKHFDVAVIGAGVAGLMTSEKLSRLGYSVGVIEQQPHVGNGPSVKNEGLLHTGTRHALRQKNIDDAKALVERCQYGARNILQYAPEAIADPQLRTFAAATEDVEEIVARWDGAGVTYQGVDLGKYKQFFPDASKKGVEGLFATADIPINVRILYQKLLMDTVRTGGAIFTNSRLYPEDGANGCVTVNGEKAFQLHADTYIVTTGYSINQLYKEVSGETLPIRYWKSHMIVMPRLARHGLMFLRDGEVNITHHGRTSVVGMWEEATEIDEPSFEVDPKASRSIFDETCRTFPKAKDFGENYLAYSCIKPDLAKSLLDSRSLDVEIIAPDKHYLFALPGKMTETPYLADSLVRMVFDKDNKSEVALRPLDTYAYAE